MSHSNGDYVDKQMVSIKVIQAHSIMVFGVNPIKQIIVLTPADLTLN